MRAIVPSRADIRLGLHREIQSLKKDMTLATKAANGPVKALFREAYKRAGLGRPAYAWQGNAYPSSAVSLSPALVIGVKGRERTRAALDAHGKGVTIRAKRARFLAVPTPFARRYVRIDGSLTQLTPEVFEQKTGIRLQFVPARAGRQALLVAPDVRVNSRGTRVSAPRGGAFKKAGGYKSGISSAVIFVLKPQVRLPQRVSLQRLAIEGRNLFTSIIRNRTAVRREGRK